MADDPTPKKSAVESININSSARLLEALEAAAGTAEARAIKENARMLSPGMVPDDKPGAPDDNDQQQAMALLLKKYIKKLIATGAITGDRDRVF